MLPIGETISPRSKFPDQPQSNQSVVPTFTCLLFWSAYANGTSSTRLFFEIAIMGQSKFKDADAIGQRRTARLFVQSITMMRLGTPMKCGPEIGLVDDQLQSD